MSRKSMMVVFGLVALLILTSFGFSVSIGAGDKDAKKASTSIHFDCQKPN